MFSALVANIGKTPLSGFMLRVGVVLSLSAEVE
jgi:hypothetical protein